VAVKEEMKSFKQHITERYNGDGDCMEMAVHVMMRIHEPGAAEMLGGRIKTNASTVLVQALVYGQGTLTGKRFPHAWVEDTLGMVYDYSNGRERIMTKKTYYAVGKIDPKQKGAYFRYAYSDVKKKLRQTGHYGPWDLDESLEEVTSRMGRMKKRVDPKIREIISEGIVSSGTGGGVRTGAREPHQFITWNDLKRLESVLDSMFKAAKLDIAFTKHFWERINGSRGYGGTVTLPEIQDAFRKTYAKYAQQINKHPADWKAIINDVSKDLNMPFSLDWDGNMKKMVMVTAMKKRNFMSNDPKLKV
jgi:hypothetical protein